MMEGNRKNLNFILKKPDLGRDGTSVKYSFSSDEYNSPTNRVEFDTNYSLKGDTKLAARVAGAWSEGDDYIKFQKNKNYAIYPVKARRLLPIFDKATDPITALNLPYNFNIAGPGEIDREKVADATLFFTHEFNDWLFFRQVANIRYFGQNSFTFTGEDNTKTVVNSIYSGTDSYRRATTTQGDLFAKYKPLSWLSGTSMIGYSYDDSYSRSAGYSGIPDAPFNQLNMVAIKAANYSADYYAARKVSTLNRTSFNRTKAFSFGMYAQQDLNLLDDRLLLTGGLRSDHDVTRTRNLVTGVSAAAADTTLNSYRYGATYKFTSKLALYVVKSVQTDPTRTIQRYNGLLAGDPRLNEFFTVSPLTELKEIGIKSELFNGRLSVSADYWEMTKTGSVVNILNNGISQGQSVTIGVQTEIQGAQSKGFEISAYGNITDRLSIIANYTKMDTSQAFTGQQNSLGWTTANHPGTIPLRFAPDWNLNIFAKYNLQDAHGQGWTLKAGIVLIGPL